MTSITGFIELLLDGEAGALTEVQKEFIEAIRRNSDRLTALANELLVLSSLESGAFAHEHEDVDLRRVVSAAQATLQPVYGTRLLEVTFAVPSTPVIVSGDQQSLESLVSNLVSNAVKFTGDGGWVGAPWRSTTTRLVSRSRTTGSGSPRRSSGTCSPGSSAPPPRTSTPSRDPVSA